MKSRGFTLIELLVVISIIALLIAILLPALSSARATAMSIQCANNHKQQFLGIAIYHNEYNNWFPPATGPTSPHDYRLESAFYGGSAAAWGQYVPMALLDCPADDTREPGIDFWSYGYMAVGNTGPVRNIGIGYNNKVGGNWHPSSGSYWGVRHPGSRLENWPELTTTGIFADVDRNASGSVADTYAPYRWGNADQWYNSAEGYLFDTAHHLGGTINMAFADGHVETFNRDHYNTVVKVNCSRARWWVGGQADGNDSVNY